MSCLPVILPLKSEVDQYRQRENVRMRFAQLNVRKGIPLFLILYSMVVHGQTNLAGSASASADTSHVDYPALAAIDGDTVDGGGWGVFAIDSADQSGINIAPGATATADEYWDGANYQDLL